eukprot:Selendium_serpulae@DN4742_c1_g2_i1.p1
MDYIVRTALSKREGAGLTIQQKPQQERHLPACNTKNVTYVFFADDGSLISCKDPENCERVRAMKDSLESMGLKVNTKKTKYMRCGHGMKMKQMVIHEGNSMRPKVAWVCTGTQGQVLWDSKCRLDRRPTLSRHSWSIDMPAHRDTVRGIDMPAHRHTEGNRHAGTPTH